MKILQINSVSGLGSTGRIAQSIHELLVAKNYQSCIAYGRESINKLDYNIRIGSKIDNYSHVIKTRILDKQGFSSIRSTKKFIEQIESFNPDIIHLHNLHGYYINIEILFSYIKEKNKKVVWTLHDCWAFTGHCTHFDYIGCEKWQVSCGKCPQKKEYPQSLFLDNSFNNFVKKKELFTNVNNLTIVTPSYWLSSMLKKSFLAPYKSIVINNGINLDIFKPSPSKFKSLYNLNEKYMILGVSNVWNEKKGIDTFFKLSKMLKMNEVIVLVGLDEKIINKLPENILGIPKTNSIEDLADIYNAADVFVNPTLEDTFPTTNLEALACGTPVVTFNTGGSTESICSKTGVIVDQGNLNGLYSAINEIKFNRKSFYTNYCREKAVKHFSEKERFEEYIELYEQIMNINEEK